LNNSRASIALRRQRVWALTCEGLQTIKIAELLHVDRRTVSLDVKFLTKESQKYLNDMAKEMLPYIYRQSMEGLQNVMNEMWARYRLDGNLYAMKLVIECHKEIMSLGANGVSVMAVKQITERANALGIGTV